MVRSFAVTRTDRTSRRPALGAIGELRRLLTLIAFGGALFVVLGVRVDDLSDERMAHDILAGQAGEVDVIHLVQDLRHHLQTRSADRQVDLRDVAGDDHAGAEAEAGEEHLHLLGRRVLRRTRC